MIKKYHGNFILSVRSWQNYNYKKIQQKYNTFKISVSHTTRKPRLNEVEGVDYFFVSIDKFKEMISKKNSTNMLKFSVIIMERLEIWLIKL